MNPGDICFRFDLLFVFFCHCRDLPSIVLPLFRSLSLSLSLSFSVSLTSFVGLRVSGELACYFFTCHCPYTLTCCLIDRVLVCTHWAFDYRHSPHLPHPLATHIHTKLHFCMFFSFSLDSCVGWQKLWRRLDTETSYPMSAFIQLTSSTRKDTTTAHKRWHYVGMCTPSHSHTF